MKDGIPACPECGGPMHLEKTAYGRAWECDRRLGLTWCSGVIQIQDDDPLSELQIAEAIARRALTGSKDYQQQQARYRRVSGPLGEIAGSPYLSGPERKTLQEARAIVERLARAAELAKDRAKRQEKRREAEREARLRQALGLLGPSLAPDPTRLEVSAVELLALARVVERLHFRDWDSIEEMEASLRRRSRGEQPLIDILFADLMDHYQTLRQDLARDWSLGQTPVEELHARLTAAMPGLREAILASPPVYLQVVRRLLAETQAENVVRLPPRRVP
jgi:hypothetical protein